MNEEEKWELEQAQDEANLLNVQKRLYLNEKVDPEELRNAHLFCASNMNEEQQSIIDKFLYYCSTELIDVALPKSTDNQTGRLLREKGYTSINEATRMREQARGMHQIFDHIATGDRYDNSFVYSFRMQAFDPYLEYEYLTDVVLLSYKMNDKLKEVFYPYREKMIESMFSQDVHYVREKGYRRFNEKFFNNYDFDRIFSGPRDVSMFPRAINGTIFVNCSFSYLNLSDTMFSDCIFINCQFYDTILKKVQFRGCEFASTTISRLDTKDGIVEMVGCYMHQQDQYILGVPQEKFPVPWIDPLALSFNENGNLASSVMLDGCVGMPTASSFLELLDRDKEGFICYKRFGNTTYPSPKKWKIEKGSFITENVNGDLLSTCDRGVNVGDFFYVFANYVNSDLWKCRIRYEDVSDVVVPWNSDGKFRAARVELLHRIHSKTEQLEICNREIEKWTKHKLIPNIRDEILKRYMVIFYENLSVEAQNKIKKDIPEWIDGRETLHFSPWQGEQERKT